MKNLKWIKNVWEPANFKEYSKLIDACLTEIDRLMHLRKKINNELKDVRTLKKHLLSNPVLQNGAGEDET